MAAGDFSDGDKYAVDKAIRAAEQSSRFEFSVFVGQAHGDPREFAQRLHASAVAPSRSVLVMVDLGARVIEVVTGEIVRRTLSDAQVELAIVQMQSAFAEGDIVSGLTRGIAQLAEHARAA